MKANLNIKAIEEYILSLNIDCIENVTENVLNSEYKINTHKYFTFGITRKVDIHSGNTFYEVSCRYKPTRNLLKIEATHKEKEALYKAIYAVFKLEHSNILDSEVESFNTTFNTL